MVDDKEINMKLEQIIRRGIMQDQKKYLVIGTFLAATLLISTIALSIGIGSFGDNIVSEIPEQGDITHLGFSQDLQAGDIFTWDLEAYTVNDSVNTPITSDGIFAFSDGDVFTLTLLEKPPEKAPYDNFKYNETFSLDVGRDITDRELDNFYNFFVIPTLFVYEDGSEINPAYSMWHVIVFDKYSEAEELSGDIQVSGDLVSYHIDATWEKSGRGIMQGTMDSNLGIAQLLHLTILENSGLEAHFVFTLR